MSTQIEKEFLEYIQTMDAYREASALIGWDLRTGAPKKTIDKRSQVISILSKVHFEMATGEKMEKYLKELADYDGEEEMIKDIVKECCLEFDRMSKIPADEYKEYVQLQSKAESIWEEAKDKADYQLFRPYLEQLIETNKTFIRYWGKEERPYDALLDMYEPGMTVEVLDEVFGALKAEIVPLVKRIAESKKKLNTDFIYKHLRIRV